MVQYYEVLAPESLGGAPVKEGRSLGSRLLGRLAVGSVVSGEEHVGERLRLRKVAGAGPEVGWVSFRLLARLEEDVAKERLVAKGGFQGKSTLARAEEEVNRLGAEAALTAASSRARDGAALLTIAVAHLTLGSAAEALKVATEAEGLLQRDGSKEGEGSAVLAAAVARLAADDRKGSLQSALRALDLFRAVGERQMEASALSTVANARLSLGEASAALSAAKEAQNIFQQIGDREGEAAAELTVTDAYIARDGVSKGRQAVAGDGAARCKERGDQLGHARALLRLASEHAVSDAKESAERAREAAAVAQREGEKDLEASALLQLAATLLADGASEEAEKASEEALRLSREAHSRRREISALCGLARALAARARAPSGRLGRDPGAAAADALAHAGEAVALCEEARSRAEALAASAAVHLALGDGAAALAAAESAAAESREAGDRRGEAAALLAGARAQLGGDAAGAKATARASLEIYAALGDLRGEASALQILATITLNAQGSLSEAMTAAERARALFLLAGDRRGQSLASHTVAQGNLLLGEVDYGLQMAMQAAVLAREVGDRHGEASALHTATHAVVRKGRYGEALRMAKEVQALFRKQGNAEMELAAQRIVDRIQEAVPSRTPVPRTCIRAQDDVKTSGNAFKSAGLFEETPTCIIWNAPVTQHTYISYCLELLKLVDDLKTSTGKTQILVTTQGVMARQIGQEMAANWTGLAASTVWALCRTVRLESPRLMLYCVDLPAGASAHEITECLKGAQLSAGPRDEIAFFIDRRNRLEHNKPT